MSLYDDQLKRYQDSLPSCPRCNGDLSVYHSHLPPPRPDYIVGAGSGNMGEQGLICVGLGLALIVGIVVGLVLGRM